MLIIYFGLVRCIRSSSSCARESVMFNYLFSQVDLWFNVSVLVI